MERRYKAGGTVALYDKNVDVRDTLPAIDCYLFEAPQLPRVA